MSKLWDQARDNVTLVLVCLLTFAIIAVLAKLFEKAFVKKRKADGARYIAYVAMFSAIGGVLMLLEIPLFFAPSFYKMDLSELPVLLCSFYLGPVAGAVCLGKAPHPLWTAQRGAPSSFLPYDGSS